MNNNKGIESDSEKIFNLGKYYFHDNLYENAYHILTRFLQLYPDGKFIKDAREIIKKIEGAGVRTIIEPIKKGIYSEYIDKQIIFCENEPGEELFIIKEGKVKIVKNNNNNEILLSVLNEGDIFGELAIVSEKPRNATAISFGGTVLLPIDNNALLRLMNKSPEILKRLFTAISQRVWFTTIRVESRLYQNPLTRIYAFLEDVLLEHNISLKGRNSYELQFGFDELLKMINLSQKDMDEALNELLSDSNLNLNFGRITIGDPSRLSDQARYYRSRDGLSGSNEKTSFQQEKETNRW